LRDLGDERRGFPLALSDFGFQIGSAWSFFSALTPAQCRGKKSKPRRAFRCRARQPKLRHSLSQAGALDQLHAEILLALMLADFVNRNDVRMIQLGHGLGLGLEAAKGRCVRQLTSVNYLDGDLPVEANLESVIDQAHAPAGDLAQ